MGFLLRVTCRLTFTSISWDVDTFDTFPFWWYFIFLTSTWLRLTYVYVPMPNEWRETAKEQWKERKKKRKTHLTSNLNLIPRQHIYIYTYILYHSSLCYRLQTWNFVVFRFIFVYTRLYICEHREQLYATKIILLTCDCDSVTPNRMWDICRLIELYELKESLRRCLYARRRL